MSIILNEGLAKQIKLSSGIICEIPQGESTQPDDAKITKVVGLDPVLSFVVKASQVTEKTVEAKQETKENSGTVEQPVSNIGSKSNKHNKKKRNQERVKYEESDSQE